MTVLPQYSFCSLFSIHPVSYVYPISHSLLHFSFVQRCCSVLCLGMSPVAAVNPFFYKPRFILLCSNLQNVHLIFSVSVIAPCPRVQLSFVRLGPPLSSFLCHPLSLFVVPVTLSKRLELPSSVSALFLPSFRGSTFICCPPSLLPSSPFIKSDDKYQEICLLPIPHHP